MKKLSIILLALAFALAFTVPAMAIHIGSEGTSPATLGISGTYQFDGQIDDTDNGKDEYFDDDLELVMKYVTGDVTAVNRQTLHGSFANSSPDMRISITFGFHRRRAVWHRDRCDSCRGNRE